MDTAPYYPEQVPFFKDSFFLLFHAFGVNGLYPSGFQGHHSTRDTHKSNQLQELKKPGCCILWKIPLTFMGGGCDKWQMCWTPPKAHYKTTAVTLWAHLFCNLSKCFTTKTTLNVYLQPVKVLLFCLCGGLIYRFSELCPVWSDCKRRPGGTAEYSVMVK